MSGGYAIPEGRPGEEREFTTRTLDALRAEREAILDAVGLTAITLGADGDTIVDVSDGATRLLGRRRQSLVGVPLSQLSSTRPPASTAFARPAIVTVRGASGASVDVHSQGLISVGDHCVLLLGRAPPSKVGWAARASREGSGAERPSATYPELFPGLVGRSPAIRKVCRLVGKVARTDSTVLVQGESGTGKEVVATTIHAHSGRRKGPLVKVNCASLSESLLESELFGHVKGAFTGAVRDRRGRFAEADGGTILLDEIGSMSLSGQTRLLRVLQEREFEPVGSSATRSVDLRVVATTNVDLERAVAEGRFRQDLFFRLGVVPIHLPPLRDRMEDVPLLAHDALWRFARHMGRRVSGFCPTAMQAFLEHDWPGNVRELENVVEYALVVEEGTEITRASLPLRAVVEAEEAEPGVDTAEVERLGLRRQLELLERQIVLRALRRANWVRKDAARELGIDPRNLSYFLRKHGITEEDRPLGTAH